jgi:hypothetical protein
LLAQTPPIDFNRDVAPILVKRCLECHNDVVASGDLVLTEHKRASGGGESGAAWLSGHPENSLLVERVTQGEMPPERQGNSQRLPDSEIQTLRDWVAAGAPWPVGRVLDMYEATNDRRAGRDWWSLQPVRRTPVPQVKDQSLVANAIDAFIVHKLEASGLEPAPRADRRSLIRRLYFDLTGLPPTHDEIETFVAESSGSDDAYHRLVDRLLSSPRYGERVGRYWLDLARFAETCGYERDQEKVNIWKYRDWVIEALNSDMPYDRFVQEQLAGDELPDRSESTVVATGFLTAGTWNDEPNDPDDYKYERLEDMVHTTTTAFLGMTVKCARCHDHKFDPIPQVDYYRVANAFWPGPIEARDRALVGGPTEEELGLKGVFGWTDLSSQPPPLHLLKKGDYKQPGPVVKPGHLTMVTSFSLPYEPPSNGAKTSQRRLQMARWFVDPRNPLTPRVMVNRLWLQLFGQGLVRTPNNFGFTGDRPTHPDLLDWLADEFVRSGWQMKYIHKLMLTSYAYQQSSIHPHTDRYERVDYNNRLWWRAERRRLTAEALRDSMLWAAGNLDLRLGGPSFRCTISPEALEGLSRKGAAWQASPEAEQRRRSVYMYSQRSLLSPMMTTFDFCDTTLPCGQRDSSTVAPQALTLLNDRFVHDCSQRVAHRAMTETGTEARIKRAWQNTLSRSPSPSELAASLEHIHRQSEHFREYAATKAKVENGVSLDEQIEFLAMASLCHVLLNSNEFIYVD